MHDATAVKAACAIAESHGLCCEESVVLEVPTFARRRRSALLEELVPVYAAWVYASFLVALPRRPELEQIVRERLLWLRAA